MEPSEPDQNQLPTDTSHQTVGMGSSLELGNVKRVLSVKMEAPESHYTTITPLGKGSFGEVHSAHDTLLGRDVAIKSLKNQFRNEEEIVDRFLKEARGTSQLEHPNIMPVHEMGVTDDLGVYFTMKKIEGEDLREILERLESNTSFYLKKYPVNRLLEIFLAVCNGVAFAHSKGVIHRDLKPANIMIGEFGEVLILDWGLVKSLNDKENKSSNIQLRMEEFDTADNTMDGAISGTPNYMSPEQAEGKIGDIDFQSDVYSLGAILYHLLAHLPPFEKTQLRKLLENVKVGHFTPPRLRRPELNIPRELDAICMKAMARSRETRYSSVESLADDIRNYISHRDVTAYKAPAYVRFWNAMRRHPVKSSVVVAVLVALGLARMIQFSGMYGDYLGNLEDAEIHVNEAEVLLDQAREKVDFLREMQKDAEVKKRSPLEVNLIEELDAQVADINRHIILAMGYFDGIPERFRFNEVPTRIYAELIWKQIEFSLHRKDYSAARQWLDTAVERHQEWNRPFTQKVTSYTNEVNRKIEGYGCLRINAVPNMETVAIYPYVETGSLLQKGSPIPTDSGFPVDIETIPKGSYLLEISLSNGQILPYPIHIDHSEKLELTPDIPSGFPNEWAYVPGGLFYFGGPLSRFYRQHEVTLPAFFISKTEVTVREYLEFWKTLESTAEKKVYMSRIRYQRRERQYNDAWSAAGELNNTAHLSLDFPVVGITREAADAFCEWKSRLLGQTVRLPTVQEWEKAARGVDGRSFVWGNGFKKGDNLTLMKYNDAGKERYPLWAPPGSFETDVSVYGAYDMAGNVREMTSTLLPGSTDLYQIKGGSASIPENFLPCSNSSDTPVVPSDVGFRYLIEISE